MKPDTTYKPVRWFVLGGPHYSSDTKFGLALTGLVDFRLNGCDRDIQPSNALAFIDVTTAKFVTVGTSGVIIFPQDRKRLNVNLSFGYSSRDYWGIGFEQCDVDSNVTKLPQHNISLFGDLLFKLKDNLFIGPAVDMNFFNSGKIERPELFADQPRRVFNYGAGIAFQYDSRDLITNASKGAYVYLKQMFHPAFVGNKHGFSSTEFKVSYYHSLWRDAIIAAEGRAQFNFGDPTWAMMAQLGGSSNMRGYYKGRYRDKHCYSTQVELRQHIWRHSGVVAWIGGGNVFHDSQSFKNHFLPNFGFGYRFEVRQKMNLRFDIGFGKSGQNGFVLSAYEAF